MVPFTQHHNQHAKLAINSKVDYSLANEFEAQGFDQQTVASSLVDHSELNDDVELWLFKAPATV